MSYSKNNYITCTLLIVALLGVSACQTTSGTDGSMETSSNGSFVPRTLDSVLASLKNTFSRDDTRSDYMAAERAYKANPDSETNTVRYARALRKQGLSTRASLVLLPYIKDSGETSVAVLNEYSAILLEQGSYDQAEIYANRAIKKDETSYEAYQNLGISLDAQGQHERSEAAFRKGLSYWEGDPLPILNNLALSLAAQGYLDDAIDILRKASMAAPQRKDIERNLRIISALNKNIQTNQPGTEVTPTPEHKPET